jgi:O-antigen/teichoic acid export membrane protein
VLRLNSSGPMPSAGVRRYRRIGATAIATAAGRTIQAVAGLLVVERTVNYLGADRYGLAATILSISILPQFLDFGLGNSLVSQVAAEVASGCTEESRTKISSAFCVLVALAVFILGLLCLLQPLIPWESLLGIEKDDEARRAFLFFLVCLVLGLPFTLASAVAAALQEAYLSTSVSTIGSLVILGVVQAAVALDLGLCGVVGASGLGNLAAVLATFAMVFFRHPALVPCRRSCSWTALQTLSKTSAGFFFLQLSATLVFGIDALIISHVAGPDMVAPFAIPWRIFAIVPLVVGFVLVPFWPAYGDAAAREEWDWIRKALSRSIAFVLLVVIPGVSLLVPVTPWILAVWIGPEIVTSHGLLAAMAFQVSVQALAAPASMLLNGLNAIRIQLSWTAALTIAVIPLKYLLLEWLGLPGIPLATGVLHLVLWVLPMWFELRRRFIQHDFLSSGLKAS